ncbi:MAG: amidohydrolase [Bryobacteraceae bacterium]
MVLILTLFAGLLGAQTADMAIRNANIHTVNPQQPKASQLAIQDGKILAVGDNAARFIGPATRLLDAQGATIIPGFIDCHVHMRGLGESLEFLDLRSARSADEVAALVRNRAKALKPGEWIRGRAWDQTRFPGGQFPNADILTKAAPEHPVYLTRVDGHAAWVNRKALELARVDGKTADPPGGRIHRDASGQPTGILIDRAQSLVGSVIPAPTDEQTRNRIARAAQECARLGITTVHDAGVGQGDLDAFRRLIEQKKLPVRVYAMIGGAGALWREYLTRGPETGDRLTVRSVKLMSDGALGSRGAALKQPYADDARNSGLLMLNREEIERIAREAIAAGFQVNTHAIGDRANREVLEAYGAVLAGKNDRRFRVEHAQVVSLEDAPLFAKYSVVASMQATHATSDMRWAEARLGPERVKDSYAWRRFLSLGVRVANGSDFPVEEPNPLWGFYAAVTRQDHKGAPAGGWFADQRMTREEALRSWTSEPAFAAFEEKQKGMLAPGMMADFVLLSNDIMRVLPAEILKTRVKMTVLGGEIVFSE